MNSGKNTALVLSGGGARGLAHIGVIEGLEAEGFKIGSIAGTSIGALVGGVYASGTLQEYTDYITSLGKMDIFKLVDFAISKRGFIKGEKVFDALKKFIRNVNIESLPLPFAAVAVDILNHREVVFTSGGLIPAIRASVAIPTVLQPFLHDDMLLVDGGVLNPLPLNRVVRQEGDVLVAVNLNADIPYKTKTVPKEKERDDSIYSHARALINSKWNRLFDQKKQPGAEIGFFDLITLSIYAMQVRLTETSLAENPPDILVNISRKCADVYDFHKGRELIDYGKEQFYKAYRGYREKSGINR